MAKKIIADTFESVYWPINQMDWKAYTTKNKAKNQVNLKQPWRL
jgi:hypothetical protein